MKSVALIGFMGTGKTSTGQILATKLGCSFVDADKSIEDEYDMSITDIFLRHGESWFRNVEQQMLKRLSARKNTVIATGGGAMVNPGTAKVLRENCLIVCLTASPECILERTGRTDDRPLLTKLNDEEKLIKIKELLKEREACYAVADYTVDTTDMSPLQVAEDIAKHIAKK